MITMSNFGLNGRLGNQMFQFAVLYSVAKRLGTKIFLHKKVGQNISEFECLNSLFQFDMHAAENCEWIENEKEYAERYQQNIKHRFSEPHFSFCSELISTPMDGIDFNGFFQSEKYMQTEKQELAKIFSLKNYSMLFKEYQNLAVSDKFISVHLRRGDYVEKSKFHFDLANSAYYYTAVSKMKERHPDAKFLIFSDDITFCKEYFEKYFDEISQDFCYVSGTTGPEDIILQSSCFGNIIANSSFSWWGAHLNAQNGPVIAPKNWFGPEGPKDTQDVYKSSWEVL